MRTIPIRQWLLALCLLALVPGRSIAQGRARTTRARDQVRIRWQDQKTAQEKTVTFSARNIALQEALDIVADLTGTKVRIHGSTVMLVPRDAADDVEHVCTHRDEGAAPAAAHGDVFAPRPTPVLC